MSSSVQRHDSNQPARDGITLPITLLVVDDDPSVRTTLDSMLQQQGYRVVLAASGMEAVYVAAEQSPAAALVDVNMSPLDGFRTCSALKAQARVAGRNLSVWLMSTGYSPMLEDLAHSLGALALLRKPFNYDDLFHQLARQFDSQTPSSA